MTNQEIRAILEGFVDEVFDCASSKAARELDVRIKTFVKAHGCEELMDELFVTTGAGETLFDLIYNFDDSLVPTMPKY